MNYARRRMAVGRRMLQQRDEAADRRTQQHHQRADDDEAAAAAIELSEDILDQVFVFLPIGDLCHASQVCKLWHEVAQREMSKRSIYHVVIPPNAYEPRHVIERFQLKPRVSLFFCASRPRFRNADNVDYATLSQYHAKFKFLGHTTVLGVEYSMLDRREIKGCHEFDRQTGHHWQQNGVLGAIMAEARDLNVKVAWCESDEGRAAEYARDVYERLRPDEHGGKPVYLMFGRSGYGVDKHVLQMLRDEYPDKQPNLWGSTITTFIKSNDSYPTPEDLVDHKGPTHRKYLSMHGFLGILLQRPRLSAYTTVVRQAENLTKRLAHFGAKVSLRRRSLGLVCGPHSDGKAPVYEAVMEAIKAQFPKVTFMGYFNGSELRFYGCDNTSADGSRELIHEKALSIMILTYD